MVDGWIKLYRKLLEWEWFKHPPTLSVFLYLLLSANIEDKKWCGIVIKRGQIVTSLEKISNATGLSIRQVRTAINHLETSQSATKTSYSKYTVFTILNYDEYQEATQSSTNKRQTNDKQATSKRQANDNNIRIKEYKKERIKENTPPTPSKGEDVKPNTTKKQFAEFVSMTDEEYSSLVAKFGEQGAKRCIEILDNYKGSSGKKYCSDYRTILNWVIKRYEEEMAKRSVQTVQPSPQASDFDPNDPYKDWGNGNV